MKNKVTDEMRTIRELSEELIQIQRPIRILDNLKWDESIKQDFFKNKFKEQPKVTAHYYNQKALSYDPMAKYEEFEDLELKVTNKLGRMSSVSQILMRMCREYKLVLRLISTRGQPEFSKYSKVLYGSAKDAFYSGGPSVLNLADILQKTIPILAGKIISEKDSTILSAEEAKNILNTRLKNYFHDEEFKDRDMVILSDQVVADAAAGAEVIKLRSDATFTQREVDLLEVHEGWVHLGTTINGMCQPYCTFLSKGPPSATITQEGLAVIMELFTFRSHPARLQRLSDRIIGINMAEDGATFIDVFNYFLSTGLDENDSYQLSSRMFRGSLPTLGPFTKDLSYTKGFVLIYNFLRIAVKHGALAHIPLLFLGKSVLEDLPLFLDLLEQNIIVPPRFLPPQFSDLAPISSWMCFSLFMNQLELKKFELTFRTILRF